MTTHPYDPSLLEQLRHARSHSVRRTVIVLVVFAILLGAGAWLWIASRHRSIRSVFQSLGTQFIQTGRQLSNTRSQAQSSACGCPAGTVCKYGNSSSQCVECTQSSQCSPGTTCVHNVCVQACSTHEHCPDGKGYCYQGGCVTCVSDAECQRESNGARQYCVRGTCVACLTSAGCKGLETCDPHTHTCTQRCNASSSSSTSTSSSSDACPSGFVCDKDVGGCVQCLESADCSGNESLPVCDTATRTCVECVANADCTMWPKGVCDARTHTCQYSSCIQLQDTSTTSTAAGYLAPFHIVQRKDASQCLTAGTCAFPEKENNSSSMDATYCLSWAACNDTDVNAKQLWFFNGTPGTSTFQLRNVNLTNDTLHGYLAPPESGDVIRVQSAPNTSSVWFSLEPPSDASSPSFAELRASNGLAAGTNSAGQLIWTPSSTSSANAPTPMAMRFVEQGKTSCAQWVA